MPRAIDFILAPQRVVLAISRALERDGSRIAINRAMIATTTSNSMRVKADAFRRVVMVNSSIVRDTKNSETICSKGKSAEDLERLATSLNSYSVFPVQQPEVSGERCTPIMR